MEIINRSPKLEKSENVLLFVHGAFHGAWCWDENFLPYFAEKGYNSYAFSFRGHESDSPKNKKIDNYGLEDYMKDLKKVIMLLGVKPVLIGHSMGGAIIQMLMKYDPELLKGVVLISSTPHDGLSMSTSMRMLKNGKKELKQLYKFSRGNVDLNTDEPDFPFDCFFSKELDMEKKKKYAMKMQVESIAVAKSFMRKIVSNPKKAEFPMFVTGGKNDWFLPNEDIKRTAEAYGAQFELIPGLNHDAMLDSNWKAMADRILVFLNENNL